jgi:hypothetical protein
MRLAETAWRKVDTTTIRHCWKKAGILPASDDPVPLRPTVPITSLLNIDAPMPIVESPGEKSADPVADADKKLDETLDELSATGVLQKKNRMDITSLNPSNESISIGDTTDEEIFQAVMEAWEARIQSEITGGDDIDADGPVETRPTYRDILLATSVISRYIDG